MSHGQNYRPSNGTEGEHFRTATCYGCTVDHAGGWHDRDGKQESSCPILMIGARGPNGPDEWVIVDGVPGCLGFRGPCECPMTYQRTYWREGFGLVQAEEWGTPGVTATGIDQEAKP